MTNLETTKIKLAIVASHPIQYWAPVYRLLDQNPELHLNVFYVAENGAEEYYDQGFGRNVKWDRPLIDGYDFKFLRPSVKLDSFDFFNVDAKSLTSELDEFQPDYVLVNGYGFKVNWRAVYAVKDRAKVIYISDSNILDSRSVLKKLIKRVILKWFFKRVDYFLITSPRNKEYLLEHHAQQKKFVSSPLPTDIIWLSEQAKSVSTEQTIQTRSNLQLAADHKIILFAGKLVSHKRPADIVFLIKELEQEPVSAVIVGSGELQESLKQLAIDLDISSRVKFTGFVNQTQLAQYFKLADVFVFPSSKEPFGLIASEVLPFGLPIIAADNIGAVGASIREDVNALLYPFGNIKVLSNQVRRILKDEDLLETLSQGSLNLAMQYDASVLADQVFNICKGKITST